MKNSNLRKITYVIPIIMAVILGTNIGISNAADVDDNYLVELKEHEIVTSSSYTTEAVEMWEQRHDDSNQVSGTAVIMIAGPIVLSLMLLVRFGVKLKEIYSLLLAK